MFNAANKGFLHQAPEELAQWAVKLRTQTQPKLLGDAL